MRLEMMRTIDRIEVRKVKPEFIGLSQEELSTFDPMDILDMSDDGLILETNNHPSIIQRLKMWLGLYKCAGDAMMNYGLQQLAISIHDSYGYISAGTSSSTPDDYTLNNLVSPVLVRVAATKGYKTTFITDDTATFIGIFTPDGTYTIVETGLHTLITGGYMGARQTTCNIPTTSGIPFGILWEVCIARG